MSNQSNESVYCDSFDTVIGNLTVVTDSNSLLGIGLPNCSRESLLRRLKVAPSAISAGSTVAILTESKRQLTAYSRGKLVQFDLPYHIDICTPFERDILNEVYAIPYGETRSYGEIAVKAGYPRAFRAVGTANARNPLPLLIPCHRVVAAHGLGGYGGGLPMKRRLLALEQANTLITNQ